MNLFPPGLPGALPRPKAQLYPALGLNALDGLSKCRSVHADTVVEIEGSAAIRTWIDIEAEGSLRPFHRALNQRLARQNSASADEHRKRLELRCFGKFRLRYWHTSPVIVPSTFWQAYVERRR